MASERERAKEEYLVLREDALKVEKSYSMVKMFSDILYMLCGGVIIAAFIYLFSVWDQTTGGERAGLIAMFVAAFFVMVGLAAFVSRVSLKKKKALHDLRVKLEGLEDKYHL